MEYLIGAALAPFIAVFARMTGLDRDRAFYPTVLIVIASYYLLFAAMAGSLQTAAVEILAMTAFVAVALVGFKLSLWWVVLGLFAHGVFDFARGGLIDNAGVPPWWPGFCLSIDVVAAGCLAFLIRRDASRLAPSRPLP